MNPDYERLFSEHVKRFSRQSGMQAGGCCPFHDDHNPSFSVNLEEGLWKCFTGCGKGNARQFCDRMGIDPSLYRINGSGSGSTSFKQPAFKSKPPKATVKPPSDINQQAQKLHQHLLDHWDDQAKELPWDKEAISDLLPGYDPARRCLTFCHFDTEGEVICIRQHKLGSITGDLKNRLFPAHKLSLYEHDRTLCFVAGEKDALTLVSHGLQAVTGTTGESSIPPDLDRFIGFREIVIVYDADETGRNGAAKLADALLSESIGSAIKIIKWPQEYPPGYDVTDFFNEGGTAEELQAMAQKAVRLTDANLKSTQVRYLPTEAGQAELFADLHRDKLRFMHKQKHWLIWNGNYWQRDDNKQVMVMAIEAAKERFKFAGSINDSVLKKSEANFAIRCESKQKLDAVLNIAQSLPPIATVPKQWDTHNHILQFENGMYDLDALELKQGVPDLMISQSTRIKFDPEAQCPRWELFLEEIMQGNYELVQFLKRSIGYCLTGDTIEQKFFMLYGAGANGKSVLLETIRSLLGDYACDSPFTAFERTRSSGNSNELARLKGVRFVTALESGESKRLDEERLKAVTGGDPITARFLFGEFFTFKPCFKLWLSVNTLPKVQDYSDGFWRRVLVVPFNARFEGNNCDLDLTKVLKNELPGIANWAIEGFEKWCDKGISPPGEVIEATRSYQSESDIVSEFLAECVMTKVDPESSVTNGQLFQEFQDWCSRQHNSTDLTQNSFTRRVQTVTGVKAEKKSGGRAFCGFRLIEPVR